MTIADATYAFSHAEHLTLLKEAIAANLRARIEHDERQNAKVKGPVELKMISGTELMRTDPNKLELKSIIEDPIRRALRRQLKDLGRKLFQLLGSTDAMAQVAEEIATMKPGRWGVRIDIIDKTWDGIGNTSDIWVA